MFRINKRTNESMSELTKNLQTRLKYYSGGRSGRADERMNEDKLRGLKKALLYSYQAATAILPGDREFRCLINPDKLKPDYDNRIISIPFKDICLNADKVGTTTEGQVETGLKAGDVFEWKENHSHWLIYLVNLEETAYFRAEIRRCKQTTEINGQKYWIAFRGPVETAISWNSKSEIIWNDLNHTANIYITRDENTLAYIHRFAKLEIDGKVWEVQASDPYCAEGVIEATIKETFQNEFEEVGVTPAPDPEPEISTGLIKGPVEVDAFGSAVYTISGYSGTWRISDKKKADFDKTATDKNTATIDILSGRKGKFILTYLVGKRTIDELEINIKSL